MSNNYPDDKKIFYTYSNAHNKMCPEYMEKYRDALVFDKLRRSIFAQQSEFGYVSNCYSGIKTYELTPNTYTVLDVENGYINYFLSNPSHEGGNLYITEVTYSELLTLISENKLIKNHYYEITDYETTTGLQGTGVGNHNFNLIVKADNEYKLNCKARAKIRPGDDAYWADSDLNKWEIWYDIKNDITKYNWANTQTGKGVIYRLIDEFGNDVNYDFKNIYYLGSGLSNKVINTFNLQNNSVVYTFSCGEKEASTFYGGNISNIKIHNFINNKYYLNNIIFKVSDSSHLYNIKIENCHDVYYLTSNHSHDNYITNSYNIYIGFNGNDTNGIIQQNTIMNSFNISTAKTCEKNLVLNSNDINLNRNKNVINCCAYCSTIGDYSNYFNSTYIFYEYNINSLSNSNNNINWCSYLSSDNGVNGICKINAIYSSHITFKKSYLDSINIDSCNSIVIDSSLTTSSSNKLKNIKLYPGLNTKTIDIPEINNDYVIEYKPNTTREYII